MNGLLRSVWRSSDGSALIEGSIVIPVLFLLVLGVFEFSFVFYEQQMISTGIRDAARYLARTSDPTDTTLQANAKTLATTGSVTGTTNRISGWTNASVTVAVANVANPVSGVNLKLIGSGGGNQVVTVSTSFTDPSLGFFSFLGLSPPTYSISHSERVIHESPPS
jgi:Flp pilus assembly protein TadG